ncbi:FKBP-type peptidyl-prolyl cis-trans isomerase [Candidatus Proelusimicrobium excrementi]|uniref:FKBP-type peptidyl-prolyl cis-trans isomerase n=1 Tax=Candidatus Proelusimicrobium excrementi TaxID=3416222 RepID=UPI003CB6F0B5|nr:FKBP-type peptidyl-prolyl cis-trans isomerase [Elusimicrobiaceae bacterium]
MKKFLLLPLLAVLVLPVFAQEQSSSAAADASGEKVLYSLGYLLGENLKNNLLLNSEDDFKAVSQGLRDALLNRNSQTNLEDYKPLVEKRYRDDTTAVINKRKIEQDEFLKEAKNDKKNQALSNGVVMRITKKGKGKTPKASSLVKVHYEGKLLDGTEFDSSIKRGKPAEFPLNGVIPCWTSALQEMKAGSKATLYCPPDTAYGNAQAGPIQPGSLLIFDVELLDVIDK